MKSALIVVDLQNDFMPGGALAINWGHLTVDVANKLIPHFEKVVLTQDWHPKNHRSFASNGGLEDASWPDHCVIEAEGAAFHKDLVVPVAMLVGHRTFIVRKGSNPDIDSYSAFFDNQKKGDTGLHDYLQKQKVTDLYVLGLATDYCVKFTVLDALELGYKVNLVRDGCRAVNLNPGDDEKAIAEMESKGASILEHYEQVLKGIL